MTVHSVLKYTQPTIVVPPNYLLFVDVLGFSDYCLHDPARATQVIGAVNFVVSEEKDNYNILAVSDSLFVHPDVDPADEMFHRKSIAKLLAFFFRLQDNLLIAQTFVRAVLDYGDYTWFQRSGMEVIYGECVVRAVSTERDSPLGLVVNGKLIEHLNRPWKELSSGYVYVPLIPDDVVVRPSTFYAIIWGYAKHHPAERVRKKYQDAIDLYRLCGDRGFDEIVEEDFARATRESGDLW